MYFAQTLLPMLIYKVIDNSKIIVIIYVIVKVMEVYFENKTYII